MAGQRSRRGLARNGNTEKIPRGRSTGAMAGSRRVRIFQRVMHHPLPEVGGADPSLLRIMYREVMIVPHPRPTRQQFCPQRAQVRVEILLKSPAIRFGLL